MAAPSRDIEDALSMLYGEDAVGAIITLKVDTKEADRIATQVAKFEPVLDVFLVTGDTDIIAKARFANYKGLKEFVMKSLGPIPGIKDTKTLMVVTTYKESGQVKEIG
ncbi:MAG: Lrp/AsnC ligand binding domain-containing protein [Euryarchaeota archaeon]|nr:Lrp/AsnC ligand binding domain-containing protein [Euryarchaeota archaeon]